MTLSRLARAVVLPAVAALALASAGAAQTATNYNVDPVHSSVAFRVLHNEVNDVIGTFAAPTGKVSLGDAGGSIEVTVNVASITSGNANRDKHLKSADYFNAEQFPTITFKADALTKNADGTFAAAGNLTLRGVTKPLTITLKTSEEKQGRRGGTVRGVATTFTVKRSDFGMTEGIPAVGDEVTLMVSLQAVKQ